MRALVVALLHRTAELRKRNHRNAEFLGEGLQATADFRNFVDAVVVGAARSLQELQIVDDDQANAMTPLQPARTRPQGGDRERRRIVDEEWQFLQFAARTRQFTEIFPRNLTHAQQFGTDARLFGQDTRCQLVGGHFEAEKGDLGPCPLGLFDPVFAFPDPATRSVERNVGRKRGLAHTGTSGENHKVAVMQAAAFGVDAVEAGGHTRKMPPGL